MKFKVAFHLYSYFLLLNILNINHIIIYSTKLHSKHKLLVRSKNSSFYHLLNEDSIDYHNQYKDQYKDQIDYNDWPISVRVANYIGSDVRKSPQTSFASSPIGVPSVRPWLKTDLKTVKQNARAEQAVGRINPRIPSMKFGDMSVEMSTALDLSAPNCGLHTSNFIVNGYKAQSGSDPWIVGLIANNGILLCSAVIINEWWVVTAAHCFEHSRNPKLFTIRAGSNDRFGGTEYQVTKVIMNERYNAFNYKESDIALLKIDGPIEMNARVRPICLPSIPYEEPKQQFIQVSGWGYLDFQTKQSPVKLRDVFLDIIPIEECAAKYTDFDYRIYRSQICTWNEGKDACNGDSGGPAYQYIKNRAILVGIVSYGVKCASDYPGVYTKVLYYLNWIQNTMDTN